MYRTIAIAILTLCCITGCSSAVNQPENIQSESEKIAPTTTAGAQTGAYLITSHTYHQGDITIRYPQIDQMADTMKEQQLNRLLKEQALSVLPYNIDNTSTAHMDVDYTLNTQTEIGLLSVQYAGILSIDNGAYPNNLFYTANIDMKKKEGMGLSDILHADESLEDWLLAQNPKALQTEQPTLGEIIDRQELIRMLTDPDSTNAEQYYELSLSLYIHEDKLGFSIPVIHALGDHAEYEVQLCSIPAKWRTQANLWQQCTKQPDTTIPTGEGSAVQSGSAAYTAKPTTEDIAVSDLEEQLKIINDSRNNQDTRSETIERFSSLLINWLQNDDSLVWNKDKSDPLLSANLTLTTPVMINNNEQNIRIISYHAPVEINGELESEYVYIQWKDEHGQLHAQLLIDGGAERVREGIVQSSGSGTTLLLGGYVSLYSPEPVFAAVWQLDFGAWTKQALHVLLPTTSEWTVERTDNEAIIYNPKYSTNQLLIEQHNHSLIITADDRIGIEAELNKQGTDLNLKLLP